MSSSPRCLPDPSVEQQLQRHNPSYSYASSPVAPELLCNPPSLFQAPPPATDSDAKLSFISQRLAGAKASFEAHVANDRRRQLGNDAASFGSNSGSPNRARTATAATTTASRSCGGSPARTSGRPASPPTRHGGGHHTVDHGGCNPAAAGFEHLNHSIEWFVSRRLATQQRDNGHHGPSAGTTSPPSSPSSSSSSSSLDAAFFTLSVYIRSYFATQDALHAAAKCLMSTAEQDSWRHQQEGAHDDGNPLLPQEEAAYTQPLSCGGTSHSAENAARLATAQLGRSMSLLVQCCGVLVRQLLAASPLSPSSAGHPSIATACSQHPIDVLRQTISEACVCIAAHLYVTEDVDVVRSNIEAALLSPEAPRDAKGKDGGDALWTVLLGSRREPSTMKGVETLHRAISTLLQQFPASAPPSVSSCDNDSFVAVTRSWPTYRELLATDPFLHMPQAVRTLRNQQRQIRVLGLWQRQSCQKWERFALRGAFRAWRDVVRQVVQKQEAMAGMQRSLTHAQQTADEKARIAKQAQMRLTELQGTSDREKRELLRERELERAEASGLRVKAADQAEDIEALRKRIEALEAKNKFLTSELQRKEEKLQKFFHQSRLINNGKVVVGSGGGGSPSGPLAPLTPASPSPAVRTSVFHFCEPERLMYNDAEDGGESGAMVEGIAELLEDLLDHLAPIPKHCFVFTDALNNPTSPGGVDGAPEDGGSGHCPISLQLSSFEDLLVFLLQRQRERVEAVKDVEGSCGSMPYDGGVETNEFDDTCTSSRLQSALGHSLQLLPMPAGGAKPTHPHPTPPPPPEDRRRSTNVGGRQSTAATRHRRSVVAKGTATGGNSSRAPSNGPHPLTIANTDAATTLVMNEDGAGTGQGRGSGVPAATLARRVVEAALHESTAQPSWVMMLCLMLMEHRDDDSVLFSKALANMCLAVDVAVGPAPREAAGDGEHRRLEKATDSSEDDASCDGLDETQQQQRIADRSRRRSVRASIFSHAVGDSDAAATAAALSSPTTGCASPSSSAVQPPAVSGMRATGGGNHKHTSRVSNVRLLAAVHQMMRVFDAVPAAASASGALPSKSGGGAKDDTGRTTFPPFCIPREEPSRLAELRRRVRDGWYRGCALERLQKHISLSFLTEAARQSAFDVRMVLEASGAAATRPNSAVTATPTSCPNNTGWESRRRRQSARK